MNGTRAIKRNAHRPRFSLTPIIARRGSMNALGRPKFGLDRLSVARPLTIVLVSSPGASSGSVTGLLESQGVVHHEPRDCPAEARAYLV